MSHLYPGGHRRPAGLPFQPTHPTQLGWRVTREAIAARAHELWEHDPEIPAEVNWRQAESEMLAASGCWSTHEARLGRFDR